MKKIAHIVNKNVVNVSLWDGVTQWESLEQTVEIPAGSRAGVGWDYVDGEFVDNRPVMNDA